MYTFWQKKYIQDIGIAIGVILLPFTIYIHLLFEKDVEVLKIFNWEIDHGFPGNDQFIWQLLIRVIPIFLFSIWFFTSSYRWRFLIVITGLMFFDNLLRSTLEVDSDLLLLLSDMIFLDIIFSANTYLFNKKRNAIRVDVVELLKKNIKNNHDKIVDETSKIRKKFGESSSKNYLNQLYHIQSVLDETLCVKYTTLSNYVTLKKNIELVFIMILLLMPLLLYSYHIIPPDTQEVSILSYVLTPNGFSEIRVLVWFFCFKLCILLPLCIWFLTCAYWWRYAILVPIILTSYQIWELFQEEVLSFDSWGNLRAFPVIFCVVLFLVLISRIVRYKVKLIDIYASISEEIEVLLAKTHNQRDGIKDLESKFRLLLKNEVNGHNAAGHIVSLTQLKNELDKIVGP